MEEIQAFVRIDRQDVKVRILKTFQAGKWKIASVEALPVNGRQIHPFTQYSIGGPSQSATANVRLDFLRGISRVTDPEPEPKPEPKKPAIGYLRINGQDVEVEVYEVYTTTHGERIAGIRAREVNGKRPTPFMNYSSERGNPMTDTARVPVTSIIGLSLADIEARAE